MLRQCLLILATVLQLCATAVYADELTAEKRADIERLFKLTNAELIGKQMARAVVDNLTKTLKSSRPDIPQKVLDMLPGEVMAIIEENMAGLYETILPIYHKHFSAEDIRGMLAFYSTPLGRKTIEVMPALTAESMAAGQRWGQALGPTLGQRLSARLREQGVKI